MNKGNWIWLGGGALVLGALASRKTAGKDKMGDLVIPRAKHVAAYRTPAGLSYDIKDALFTDIPTVVANAVDKLNSRGYPNVAPGAFAGIAKRETGFKWNEEDFDYNDDGSLRRHTYGVYQGDRPESSSSLDIATEEFTDLLISHLQAVSNACVKNDKPHAFNMRGEIPLDAYAYAAWMHNAGQEAITSINKYGMDWHQTIVRNTNAFKANPNSEGAKYMVSRMIPYANEVKSFVAQYPNAKLVA